MTDYKRLTERDEFGNADIIGVDSCDLQGNLPFEQFNLVTKALNRFASLEDKIESGELRYVPCKVGDEVFVVRSFIKDFTECYSAIDTGHVKKIYLNKKNELWVQVICWGKQDNLAVNGKRSLNFRAMNVFKTRELAENRLKELQSK